MKHMKKTNNKKKMLIIVLLVLLTLCIVKLTYSKYISTISNIITVNITKPKYYINFYDGNEAIGSQEFKYGTAQQLNSFNLAKEHYIFAGWNTEIDGSGIAYDDGEEVNRLSTINGDVINFYAMWELDDGISYRVVHKKMDLDGVNYTIAETELLYGEENAIVSPDTKEYTGFTSPIKQYVRISGDGSTEIEYLYSRNKYTLDIGEIALIDTDNSTAAGEYYYETPVRIIWKGHRGCTFIKWSNDETTQMIEFVLTENTNISPIFEYETAVFKQYDSSLNELFGIQITKTDITYFGLDESLTEAEVLAKPGVTRIDNTLNDGYTSENPVYGWIENGEFRWWSNAYTVYFHPDTLNAFEEFSNIVTIDLTGTSTELVRNFANWFNKDKLLVQIIGKINTNGVALLYNNSYNYTAISNDTKTNVGMSFMFNDCNALLSIDLSEFNTSNVTDMKRMFGGCRSITALDVSTFDTSKVRSFYWMFRANEKLLELDISNFDTSSAVSMFGMFVQAQKVKTITFGENFKTDNVVVMENMFYQNKALQTIYVVSNINTDNVTKSNNMFYLCNKLVGEEGTPYRTPYNSAEVTKTYARIAEPDFPGYFTAKSPYETYTITYNLNGGSVSNPITYSEITGTFTLNQPIKTGYTFLGWTGSNGSTPQLVVTIEQGSTGNKEYIANYIANTYTIIFDANGGEGTMADQVFIYDVSQALRLNAYTRDGFVFKKWNTRADGNGTSYSDGETILNLATSGTITLYAQYRSTSIRVGYFKEYDGSIDGILGFAKDNLLSFERATNLDRETVLGKSGVTLISNTVNDGYLSAEEIYGWVESNHMYWWSEADIVYFHPNTLKAFNQCSKIVTIDLTGTSTEKVRNFAAWFNKDVLLKYIIGTINTDGMALLYNNNFNYLDYGDGYHDFCSDVGMAFMFNDCKVLTAIDLSEFNTRNATDMMRMFGGCKALTSLDVSNFDTRNVRSMYWMFRQNENLTSINLSSFNTSNVQNMFGMFVSAKKLETVTLGPNFDTSSVVILANMFYANSSLQTIYAVNDFDTASLTDSSNMFKNCSNLVGAAGTTYQTVYSSGKTNASYAKIATENQQGYFTQSE